MAQMIREEIKKYVADWHYDENSKQYAYELGKFLFSFMDYLEDLDTSKRNKSSHRGNLSLIGHFELNYGYNHKFSPKYLTGGPHFLYEFERKVSNSKYAIQSYKSTWRKLDTYIKSGDYEKYLKIINDKINQQG